MGTTWEGSRVRIGAWMLSGWMLLAAGHGAFVPAAVPGVHELDAQYRFSCAQCHGPSGTARTPSGIKLPGRVLADRKWLARQKDEDLVRSILGGKGAMPGFRNKMTPEEAKGMIARILKPMARKAR